MDFVLSQDDFLENDSLEKLCRRQLETGADAVIPKTIYYYATQKNNHVQLGLNGNISPVINGCQAFMLSLDYSIPGHVLWNMDVIRANSDIPTDTFDSDDYMQRVWFYHCKKVAFSDAAYYYRQDNSDAITKKIGYYRFETLRTNLRLLDLVYKYNIDSYTIDAFKYYLFNITLDYLALYYHHKSEYSLDQRISINQLIYLSYKALRKYEKHTWKRILAFNFFIFKVAAFFKTCIKR